MGKTITHIGGHGAGQTCKVANQIVVALTIEAVSEGLLFASKAGADVSKVRESLLGGLAQSKILDVHGQRMIDRTFDPGFKIKLHQKDLNLALEGARSLDLALPGTANAQQLFQACVANGGATGTMPAFCVPSNGSLTMKSAAAESFPSVVVATGGGQGR